MNPIEKKFATKLVAHLRLKEINQSLLELWTIPDGELVILLVGPTGAGKSTFLAKLHRDCFNYYQAEMAVDLGLVPSLMYKLPSPIPRIAAQQGFDWKDSFTRILNEGYDVLIKKKAIPRIALELDGERISEIHGLTPSELRRSLENFGKERKTKQFLLDEASHIFVGGQPASAYELHFEMLKSMSIAYGRPWLLAGGYDLLKALEFNGALNRRIQVFNLGRYTAAELQDPSNLYGQSFKDLVYSLLSDIGVHVDEGLMGDYAYFLMKSIGSAGILKDWLKRTLRAALKLPDPKITRELLDEYALPNRRLMEILRETELGEEKLKDISDRELALALGLDAVPAQNKSCVSIKNSPDTTALAKSKTKVRPGKRKPSRDPIGGQ